MLIYDRNIVMEGGTGLEEELISKKELLEQYQISYGALYRWKRMGLIPEGWFCGGPRRPGRRPISGARRSARASS